MGTDKLRLTCDYIRVSAKAEQKLKSSYRIYLQGNEIQAILSEYFNLKNPADIIYKQLSFSTIINIVRDNQNE